MRGVGLVTGIGDEALGRVNAYDQKRSGFNETVGPTISLLARDFARTATAQGLPGNAGGKVHTWTGADSDPRIWKVPLWPLQTRRPRRNPLKLPYVGDDGDMLSVWVFEDTGEWGVVHPGRRPKRGDHDLAGPLQLKTGNSDYSSRAWPDVSPEYLREMFVRDLSRRIAEKRERPYYLGGSRD